MIKFINELNISNKRLLIRVDFNVPIINNKIDSDFRILAIEPTLDYCIKNKAKIILMSHLGRPKGIDKNLSLFPIYKYLKKKYLNVFFSDNCISKESIKFSHNMDIGTIHLLENLRFHNNELNNCREFANSLSEHGEIYINDAFGTSHRKHASNSAILSFFQKKAFGFLMKRELKYLSNINFNDKPVCLLLGGAKISSKLSMIKYFIGKADYILIGGGMAFTFLKVLGYNIGKSLFEKDMLDYANDLINNSKNSHTKILLPCDVACLKDMKKNKDYYTAPIDNILDDYYALDIGEKTVELFKNTIKKSKLIIWNGPMGVFEINNFKKGTKNIARYIKEISNDKDLLSIIGGGDTANCIIKLGLEDVFTHVSTGGGASLQLLSGKKLQILESWSEDGK